LAYALAPEFWGQGLASEIARGIRGLAVTEIGLSEVVCFTLLTNRDSQRVMQKVGFRFERDGMHADLPHVFYRLRAADFATSAGSEGS
jgi:[ribosomal protein S5]-alanine N-acetyltransferase